MKRVLVTVCVAAALAGCKTTSAPAGPPDKSVTDDVSLTLAALPLEAADAPVAAAAAPAETPAALATLGMISSISARVTEASTKALDAYMKGQLGGAVAIKTYPNVAALAEALAAGQVDIAWLTPTAYVAAAEKSKVKPLARFVRGGYAYYRSALFVRKDTPLTKIAELKGHKVIWAPQGSASGRLFPQAMLRKLDLDPAQFFSAQLDAADHNEVCLAVQDGKADVGATISDEQPGNGAPVADGCRGAGLDPAQFRVVATSDRIPNDVIASRQDLPAIVEGKLKDALLNLGKNDEGKALLKTIFRADGFTEVADADFQPVRDAQAAVAK
jgi:phosphonate transport system substrate-binding protein